MESYVKSSTIKMELMDLINFNGSVAFGPLTFEDGRQNIIFSEDQGNDINVISNQPTHRRQVASQLLEVLECQDQLDEPTSGWLEEQMDLELFGQSVGDWSQHETEFQMGFEDFLPIPSSPTQDPLTPIHPSSPDGMHFIQADSQSEKLAEQSTYVDEGQSLIELLLSQIQTLDPPADPSVATPTDTPSSVPAEEIGLSDELLDQLIKDELEKGTAPSDITLDLMENIEFEPNKDEGVQVDLNLQGLDVQEADLSLLSVPSRVNDEESSGSDEDWEPEPVSKRRKYGRKNQSMASPVRPKEKDNVQDVSSGPSDRRRKRLLPTEDRRMRKKEQNKTAATRYRLKKKAELETLLEEEAQQTERHRQLKNKHDELAKEVSYLKKLLREVFQTRGILKND